MKSFKDIQQLNKKQRKALSSIRPCRDSEIGITFYPCDVTLTNGEKKCNVLLVDTSDNFNSLMGIDHGGVNIEDVKTFTEIENRLPEHIERKIGAYHETAMGGIQYSLILKDGSKIIAQTGSAAKVFLDFSEDIKLEDIVDVNSYTGSWKKADINTSDVIWCFFR